MSKHTFTPNKPPDILERYEGMQSPADHALRIEEIVGHLSVRRLHKIANTLFNAQREAFVAGALMARQTNTNIGLLWKKAGEIYNLKTRNRDFFEDD